VLDPREFNANATPGAEIYFKEPVGMDRLQPTIEFRAPTESTASRS
jgi:hypothetical protein